MDVEEGNLAVFAEAKTEYTQQFINLLKPCIYKSIHSLFIKSKSEKYVLKKFQEELSKIPLWTHERIATEHKRIITISKCEWVDDLLTAVILSHVKVLTSINTNKVNGKLDLKLPKTNQLIHKCYVDVARNIWKNSSLFDDRVSNKEKQKNKLVCDKIIEKSILETIRNSLPVGDILKMYIGNDFVSTTLNSNPIKEAIIHKIDSYSDEKLLELQSHLENDSNKIVSKPEEQTDTKGTEVTKVTEVAEEEPKEVVEELKEIPVDEQVEVELTVEEPKEVVEELKEIPVVVEEPVEVDLKVEEELEVVEEPVDMDLKVEEPQEVVEEPVEIDLKVEEPQEVVEEPKEVVEEPEVESSEHKLQIEELNWDDLNDYEEIYDTPVDVEVVETKAVELPTNTEIKTISLTDTKMTEVVDLKDVVVTREPNREDILEKYKKNKTDIKFF